MENIINIVFDNWQGYNPLYWKTEKNTYFSYGNINVKMYPPKYPGFRVAQRINNVKNTYQIQNEYLHNNAPIDEERFKNTIPITQYICRPIRFENQFVYRIHLPITPPSDFFDGLNKEYYIRKTKKLFNPKDYYDPFTLSILNESAYIHISPQERIVEKINEKLYPYVARDFIIETKDIKDFMEYMEKLGYQPREFIQSHEDVYHELMVLEKKITDLTQEHQYHSLKEEYIREIFQCNDKSQLKKIKGKVHITLSSIGNTFTVIWDEAFELKNIYQKFQPIKPSEDIHKEKINELYTRINKQALEGIALKNKTINYLVDMIIWKRKFINHIPELNSLKPWILTATQPLHIFANQLEIKDTTGFDKINQYHNELIFKNDKYALTIEQDIYIDLIKNKEDNTPQEEIKSLLEEYKNTKDTYTKHQVHKKIQDFKFVLKMIHEIKTFL